MIHFNLPTQLEAQYHQITKQFLQIRSDWRKYNDQIIPEDREFARQIALFLIAIIDHILANYNSHNLGSYQEFLGLFHYEFLYGPHEDDHNYLDFDEQINGENFTDFCSELRMDQKSLTKTKLRKIKQKYLQFLKK